MKEWVELRKKARNELVEVLKDKAKILLERKELFVSVSTLEREERRERMIGLNKRLANTERKEYVLRGQITVMDKILNYDYPFKVGGIIEIESNHTFMF